ncbi:Reverse transcriptase [Phytophthora palmivora]|uniref:Reverse transcriptase n=1 Tax=Phytophthora palmivora TaxID=4796 RepID=A0A2P4XUH9_9STRA|nr:Reverse transcriptase [Phytophthora palmivora]
MGHGVTTRQGSEILKNPEDSVYPLVEEFSDVVSKHPPPQLPPDRGRIISRSHSQTDNQKDYDPNQHDPDGEKLQHISTGG